MLHKSFWFTAIVLLGSQVHAAEPVTLMTGSKTGTYYAVGEDIASIATKEEGQPVTILTSHGSVENLQRLTDEPEKIGASIVQSDVLGFLQRSSNPRSKQVAQHLRLIFPLYKEEVHVLAHKEINRLADLQGKRVVIGQAGSGNMLTAINIFSLLGIAPKEKIQLPPPEGVVAVLAGEADAVIFTGGKPVTLFKNLEEVAETENATLLKQVHFVPITEKAILKEYEPAALTEKDYRFIEKTVPTVAVRAALISSQPALKDKALSQSRCEQLDHIGRAVRMHKTALINQGHAKWAEVDPYRSLPLWKRDMCAWQREASERSTSASPRQSGLERALLDVIEKPRKEK